MIGTLSYPKFVLQRGNLLFGGMAMQGSGLHGSPEVHIFATCNEGRAIRFCTRKAADATARALIHHGIKGWKSVDLQ